MALGGDLLSSVGRSIGDELQHMLGFKTGGRVRGKKGQKAGTPITATVHVGEYVLPRGVTPTKTQVAEVTKIKRVAREASKAKSQAKEEAKIDRFHLALKKRVAKDNKKK